MKNPQVSALTQAYIYQTAFATPQLDWQSQEQVMADVLEEIRELLEAQTPEERAAELGDLLFVLVNWGRWAGVNDPEKALRDANARFDQRLKYIQQAVSESGKPFHEWTTGELSILWNEAKNHE